MSSGPQDKQQLPDGWRGKLAEDYLALGFSSLGKGRFLASAQAITERTIRGARKTNTLTERSLDDLAEKLNYPSREAMLEAWRGALRTPLFLVPSTPTPFFTGRYDLLERIGTGLRTSSFPSPSFWSAPPGIGKTQAALVFAYRHGAGRDDASGWLLTTYLICWRSTVPSQATWDFVKGSTPGRMWSVRPSALGSTRIKAG